MKTQKENKITLVICQKENHVIIYLKEFPKLYVTDLTEELAKQKILSLIESLSKEQNFLNILKRH